MSLSIQRTPTEAFFELKEDPCSLLIDVRSSIELSNDGIADLSDINRETVFTEWRSYPSMEINNGFFEEIEEQQKKKEYSSCFSFVVLGFDLGKLPNIVSRDL